MKYKIFCFLVIFLTTFSVAIAGVVDHLVISEVQTDSIDGSGGTKNDFIEIYNPTGSAIDLVAGGFRVERWTSGGTKSIVLRFGDTGDASFPGGSSVSAYGFYLIVDSDADDAALKSSADALVSRTFALSNDGAVALGTAAMSDGPTDSDVVDFIGWGENSFFEGSVFSANPVGGSSLERKSGETHDVARGNGQDSNNNSTDFFIQTSPNPQNTESSPENPAPVAVVNSAPAVPTELLPSATTNAKIFSAKFSDSNGDVGTVEFRVFLVSPTDCSAEENLTVSGRSASTASGAVASFTPDVLADAAYFWCARANDGAENSAWTAVQNFTLDTVAPSFFEGSALLATEGDASVALTWPVAEGDVEKYFLRVGGGEAENLGKANSFTKSGLTNGQEYEFSLVAVDAAGNESAAIATAATPVAPQIFTTAVAGEIILNEVAWAGSTVSSSDEWVELRNTTSNKIFNLADWTLAGAATGGGDFTIGSGVIQPGAYFLIANNSATHSFSGGESVLAIEPNFFSSSLSLSNSSFQISLRDSADNEIDSAGDGGEPPSGSSGDLLASMLRLPDLSAWVSASHAKNLDTGVSDLASPAADNFFSHDLALVALSISSSNPLPSEAVIFTAEIKNQGLDSQNNFELKWLKDDVEISSETISNALTSFGEVEKTFSQSFAKGNFVIAVQIISSGDEEQTNNSKTLSLAVSDHLVLSEFVPNPEGSDTENEWIEIFNLSDSVIDLTNFTLSALTISSGSLSANSHAFVSAGDQTADSANRLAWSGNWPTLSNTSGEVILKNASGEIIDSKSYSSVVEKKSFGRNPENIGEWLEFFHPTQGSQNIETNNIPVAQITIQGSGNTSGSCSLFVNLTAEDSTDSDSDELSYEWDFGDGNTSEEENPSGFYFSQGNYDVKLTATDVLGGVSGEVTQAFTVSGCSSAGGGGGSTWTTKTKTDEPILDSIPATRVEVKITEVSFDSAADWIELKMLKDGNAGNGADISGFYFEIDKRVKTIPRNTKLKTGEFLLLTFKSSETDFTESKDGVWEIFSTKNGITKTDEQVTLRDSTGEIEDAVVWENRDGKWSRGEDVDVLEIVTAGAWSSEESKDALDSGKIRREVVFARHDSVDTDSAADWFITPMSTPGKENSAPLVRAGDFKIIFTELQPRNPQGDFVKIECPDCLEEINLAGFFLKTGKNSEIFRFPADAKISQEKPVEIFFGSEEAKNSDSIFHSISRGLVASDELLTLKDFENTTADFIGWSNRLSSPVSDSDLSLSELAQLKKHFRNSEWDSAGAESLLDSREIQAGGKILRVNFADSNSAADWKIENLSEVDQNSFIFSNKLRISEIFPNPVGKDAENEWFEIENFSAEDLNLLGWSVSSNKAFHEFEENIIFKAGEFKTFRGLFSIRNSGGTFILADPEGEIIHSLEYPEVSEGNSFARTSKGEFLETEILTPEASNGFYRILTTSEDADADGLPDSREAELGSDPEKFDTDEDGLPDFFEIQKNLDPNLHDSSPENLTDYRSELAALASSKFDSSVDEQNGVFLTGIGMPSGKMRIYIQSELKVIEVPVDETGRWSYVLDQTLEAGNHNIFTQLIDPAGFEGIAKKVLSFNFTKEFIPPAFATELRLSEILPNPVGKDAENEFIEIENFSSTIADLSNYKISVGRKNYIFPANTTIPAGEFLLLRSAETKLTLPNSGSSLTLALLTGRVISELVYQKLREGSALAFDSSAYRETVVATPAAPNQIVARSKKSKKKTNSFQNGDLSNMLKISEVFANPVGRDSAEWIELWNAGETSVNLGNWRLDDSAGGSKAFVIPDTTILRPGEFHIFPKALTKIQLNNSGDEVRLFDFTGKLISQAKFHGFSEGVSLALGDSGFRETEISTPNARSEFDAKELEGRVRFVGEEGFILENSAGEFFVKFGEESPTLLAQALLRKGGEWRVFVRGEGEDLTLKNFTVAPSLLRSDLAGLSFSAAGADDFRWVFALLIFAVVFFFLRFFGMREAVGL